MKYNKEQLAFFEEYLPKQGYSIDKMESLAKSELKKAHDAYRQHKKRKSDAEKGESKKTVNLTQEAHDILCRLSKKDNVTLSQWIVKNLDEFLSPKVVTPSHKSTPIAEEFESVKTPRTTITIPKKIITATSEDFNIEIELRTRLSAATSAGYFRHADDPTKREIYDVIVNCRKEIKNGKDKVTAIGETYEILMDNKCFLEKDAFAQCSLIAAILESKSDDNRKPPRVYPKDIANAIKAWLEIQETSLAITN